MPVVAGQNQSPSGLGAVQAPITPQPTASPQASSNQNGGFLEKAGQVANAGNFLGGKNNSDRFFSGGVLSDIGDILQAPQFALTGLLSGKGIKRGIEERITPSKALNIENPFLGFAADVVLDPLNLAFGAGLLSKGAKLAQLPKLAKGLDTASRLGSTGMVAKGAQKLFSPVTDVIGPKIEPVIRKAVTGAEPLSNAEKLRAEQIARGGTAVSETSQRITEATRPISEILKEKAGGFKLFQTKSGAQVTVGDIVGVFKNEVPDAFRGARSTLEAGVQEGAELAVKTGGYLTEGLSKAQQQRLGQIIKGGVSVSTKEEPLRVIAGMARRTVDGLSKELVEELKTGGMGKADDLIKSVMDNIGTYMPRMYRQFVEDPKKFAEILTDKKTQRIIRDRFMKREDIPDEIRKKMGEIMEPGFPTATGIKQVTQAIETSKFFRFVAKNFAQIPTKTLSDLREEYGKMREELSELEKLRDTKIDDIGSYIDSLFPKLSPDSEIAGLLPAPKEGVKYLKGRMIALRNLGEGFVRTDVFQNALRRDIARLEKNMSSISSRLEVMPSQQLVRDFSKKALSEADLLNMGYVRLADTASLGILRGKFVPRAIADDINAVGNVSRIGENKLTKVFDAYKKALGYWKFGKVILNPATQARNFLSNLILMDLAHYPVFTPQGAKFFTEAAVDYAKKGELYQLGRKTGLMGGTYFGNEVKNLLNNFDEASGGNILQNGLKTFFQKAGASYQGVEETSKLAMMRWRMSQGDSAKQAADYANKWLFDYRKVPPAIKMLRDVPFGFPFITFTYKSLPRLAEKIATNPGDVSKYYKAFGAIEGEGRAQEEALLPEYIKNGMYVRLPFDDENGNPLYFNMNYILPWGNLGEAANTFLPSDPAATFLIAAKTGVNPFNQQEIFKETDDPDEKLIKLVNFVYATLMPSLAPQVPLAGLKGGYSYEKLLDAIFERPDRNGDLRDLPTTFLDVGFGLKAQPVDMEEETVKRTKEFQRKRGEIQQNIRNIARDQSLSDEERNEKIEREVQKIQREANIFSERFGPQF